MYKPAFMKLTAKQRTPEEHKVAKRIVIEHRIARHLIRDLLNQGFAISINNGGDEDEIECSTSFSAIIDAMAEADDDHVYVHRKMDDGKFNDKVYGSIHLVYGNDGYDLIANYSIKLEDIIKGTNEYAETYNK